MTCAGLLVIGLILHLMTGGVDWNSFSWPLNLCVAVAYLVGLVALYSLRKKLYFVRWAMSYKAAIPSLAAVSVLTFCMGMIKQVPGHVPAEGISMFNRMISWWPFVLEYFWMTSIVGLVSLKHLFSFRFQKIPFLLNHFGLFVALVSATLGSADMKRLTMNTRVGQAEWRATDTNGQLTELPLAIELKNFSIEEYPPKLMLINNETGQALPKDVPEHLLLEEKVERGRLLDWDISILQSIPMAASVAAEDTLKFTEFHSMGATYAVYLKAVNATSGQSKEGWVSCGSFMFPYKALRLSEQTSLVMPEREPQRFVSAVTVYTQSGEVVEDTIEVNRPLKIFGWNIYQLSYDETKGRWSDVSVFELVRDPWLPAVYAGIIMMVLGAVCLFVNAPKGTEERKEETV